MKLFSSAARVFVFLAASALPLSVVQAAPRLLVPHSGNIPKSEKARPFKSEGQRVHVNRQELERVRDGEELELALPNGKVHVFTSDLLKHEDNGITTWVGRHEGSGEKLRAIITTGPAGSFGSLSTPDGEFRLVPGEGHDWLIDMTAEAPYLPPIDLSDDVRVPKLPKTSSPQQLHEPTFAADLPGLKSLPISKAAPTPQVVVDLMVVATTGYAANLGATLGTRLAFLVQSANTMFADSEVAITLRLVHTATVNYPDSGSGSAALNAITPAQGGPSAEFAGIETLRTQYGADMVLLLRNGSDLGGSGIAWIADQPMASFYAPYMYGAVTGCVRGCEWVIIHELGHNMGNAHDRATVAWQDGGVASPSPGSYSYSFGYALCGGGTLSCNPNIPSGSGGCGVQPECSTPRNGSNNFSDVMAYFHGTTTRNFKFSNPAVNCAGSLGQQVPCGVASGQSNSADAALSMNNNRTALSALRATAAPVPNPPRLANISTRMQVLTGADVMIGGFVIGGASNKTVVVRARGPSLTPLGVANAIANPQLQLFSGQTQIGFNDNYTTAPNLAALNASGFAPSNPLEAAILVTLAPGAYTAIVSGSGGGTGVGIVEVFEVDAQAIPLINIATRGRVLTGDNVMIGGFIVQGTGPQTVVVRARGPSLIPTGVADALANPSLAVYAGQTVIASNDNFGTLGNLAALQATGFAPANALESAVLLTLQPGAYTAIVSGAGGTTGVGIVEVFTVP